MDLSGRKFGKYELTESLGHGGMAEVYKAYQPGLDRWVAIKVLHSHLAKSPDFVTRFKREAKSIGQLQHKNILPVIDFDIEDGTYYMVMAYVQGGTLEAYMETERAIPVPESLGIMSQLLDGIEYAHQQGMIHRDIKPGNIMFMDETHRQPVLTDFGLVRLVNEAGLTMSGTTVGTPAYMPPEAAKGEKVDERGDLYGLGVVLFEMVTGDIPYKGNTPFAIIMQQVNDPLPPPREINPDLPEGVDAFLIKALAKEPSERFQTAAEMKAALLELHDNLAGDGSTIINISPVNRTQIVTESPASAEDKSWMPLVAAVIGALLIIGLTVGGLMMMGQNDDAERASLTERTTVTQTDNSSAKESAAPPTDTPAPTPTVGPKPVGRLRFLDSESMALSEATLNLNRVEEPSAGNHYQLWLANEDQSKELDLGQLSVENSRIEASIEELQNLAASYNQVLISLEADGQSSESISELVLFIGHLPFDYAKHLRQILPAKNGEGGFLADNQTQLDLAFKHSGFIQDAIEAEDYPLMLRHAEHVVNITDGVDGSLFGDYDGDGVAQNPGDGVGIRGYLNAISQTVGLAMAETDSPELLAQGEALQQAIQLNLKLSDQVVNQALQIFATDTTTEAQPMVENLRVLLQGLLSGFDFDENGLIEETVAENFMPLAYDSITTMMDITIFPTDLTLSEAVLRLNSDGP